METADWLVMLSGDGTVAAVDGGAPAGWIARRVDDCAGMPEAVRAAACGFVREMARPSNALLRRARLPPERDGAPSFTLLAVEAIPLRPADVDLDPLIQRTLVPLSRQAESAHVTLRIAVSRDLPPRMSIDAEKIAWAVTVLVGNALRHVRRGSATMPGGRIAVHAAHNQAQRMVSITVEDDGQGIPARIRPWLVEPDPETGQPAGVALRLVHDVVVAHGGGMVIKSSTEVDDRGTTVTLWLPVRG